MPFLKNNKPRTTQPQVAVRVNSSYANGLAFLGVGSSPRNLVFPTAVGIVPQSGTTTVARAQGLGWNVPATTAGAVAADAKVVTSNGSGGGDYCVFVYASPVASGTSNVLLAQYNVSTAHQVRMQANLNGSFSESSGAFVFLDLDASSVFSGTGVSSGAVDGLPHMYAGVRRGSTYELWIDGRMVSSASQTVRDIYTTDADMAVYIGADPAGARPALCPIFMVGGFDRAPAVAELAVWGRNPWQLFTPESRRIWVPSAGGGSPYTLALANGSYTHIGNTTALKASRKLSFNSEAYVTLGQAATLLVSRKLPLNAGSYSVIGNTTALKVSRKLVFSSESYSFTGYAATLTYTPAGGGSPYTLALAAGSYTFSGQTTTLKVARKLAFSTGSYTTTGRTVTLKAIRKLAFNSGSYVFDGKNVSLTYSGAPVSGMPPYITVYMWKRTA